MITIEQLEKEIRKDFESAGGFSALIADILQVSEMVDPKLHGESDFEEASIDCRLRYHKGSFYWLTGSSDYDQDHRGYWGCSCVIGKMSKSDAKAVAYNMLEQVIESACESL